MIQYLIFRKQRKPRLPLNERLRDARDSRSTHSHFIVPSYKKKSKGNAPTVSLSLGINKPTRSSSYKNLTNKNLQRNSSASLGRNTYKTVTVRKHSSSSSRTEESHPFFTIQNNSNFRNGSRRNSKNRYGYYWRQNSKPHINETDEIDSQFGNMVFIETKTNASIETDIESDTNEIEKMVIENEQDKNRLLEDEIGEAGEVVDGDEEYEDTDESVPEEDEESDSESSEEATAFIILNIGDSREENFKNYSLHDDKTRNTNISDSNEQDLLLFLPVLKQQDPQFSVIRELSSQFSEHGQPLELKFRAVTDDIHGYVADLRKDETAYFIKKFSRYLDDSGYLESSEESDSETIPIVNEEFVESNGFEDAVDTIMSSENRTLEDMLSSEIISDILNDDLNAGNIITASDSHFDPTSHFVIATHDTFSTTRNKIMLRKNRNSPELFTTEDNLQVILNKTHIRSIEDYFEEPLLIEKQYVSNFSKTEDNYNQALSIESLNNDTDIVDIYQSEKKNTNYFMTPDDSQEVFINVSKIITETSQETDYSTPTSTYEEDTSMNTKQSKNKHISTTITSKASPVERGEYLLNKDYSTETTKINNYDRIPVKPTPFRLKSNQMFRRGFSAVPVDNSVLRNSFRTEKPIPILLSRPQPVVMESQVTSIEPFNTENLSGHRFESQRIPRIDTVSPKGTLSNEMLISSMVADIPITNQVPSSEIFVHKSSSIQSPQNIKSDTSFGINNHLSRLSITQINTDEVIDRSITPQDEDIKVITAVTSRKMKNSKETQTPPITKKIEKSITSNVVLEDGNDIKRATFEPIFKLSIAQNRMQEIFPPISAKITDNDGKTIIDLSENNDQSEEIIVSDPSNINPSPTSEKSINLKIQSSNEKTMPTDLSKTQVANVLAMIQKIEESYKGDERASKSLISIDVMQSDEEISIESEIKSASFDKNTLIETNNGKIESKVNTESSIQDGKNILTFDKIPMIVTSVPIFSPVADVISDGLNKFPSSVEKYKIVDESAIDSEKILETVILGAEQPIVIDIPLTTQFVATSNLNEFPPVNDFSDYQKINIENDNLGISSEEFSEEKLRVQIPDTLAAVSEVASNSKLINLINMKISSENTTPQKSDESEVIESFLEQLDKGRNIQQVAWKAVSSPTRPRLQHSSNKNRLHSDFSTLSESAGRPLPVVINNHQSIELFRISQRTTNNKNINELPMPFNSNLQQPQISAKQGQNLNAPIQISQTISSSGISNPQAISDKTENDIQLLIPEFIQSDNSQFSIKTVIEEPSLIIEKMPPTKVSSADTFTDEIRSDGIQTADFADFGDPNSSFNNDFPSNIEQTDSKISQFGNILQTKTGSVSSLQRVKDPSPTQMSDLQIIGAQISRLDAKRLNSAIANAKNIRKNSPVPLGKQILSHNVNRKEASLREVSRQRLPDIITPASHLIQTTEENVVKVSDKELFKQIAATNTMTPLPRSRKISSQEHLFHTVNIDRYRQFFPQRQQQQINLENIEQKITESSSSNLNVPLAPGLSRARQFFRGSSNDINRAKMNTNLAKANPGRESDHNKKDGSSSIGKNIQFSSKAKNPNGVQRTGLFFLVPKTLLKELNHGTEPISNVEGMNLNEAEAILRGLLHQRQMEISQSPNIFGISSASSRVRRSDTVDTSVTKKTI